MEDPTRIVFGAPVTAGVEWARLDALVRFEDDHRRLGGSPVAIGVQIGVDGGPALPQPLPLSPGGRSCVHRAGGWPASRTTASGCTRRLSHHAGWPSSQPFIARVTRSAPSSRYSTMTLRSCPDLRPTVVRRSAPQPRLFDVVHRNRPPLSRYSARCPRQARWTNHGGGIRGGRTRVLIGPFPLPVTPARAGGAATHCRTAARVTSAPAAAAVGVILRPRGRTPGDAPFTVDPAGRAGAAPRPRAGRGSTLEVPALRPHPWPGRRSSTR